ncbi:hypothetical protein ABN242_08725 [Providencia alcalifaciens]|uniref:hypothetical protein n=1 Tax=Providencia TaxID=586 RepID=UPI00234BFABB|nr:hypothetical protein [Providencia sp. PROV033]
MIHINNLSHAESLQHLEKYQKRCINTFLKKQAFFEHLDAANRSTTKCPALAKKPLEKVNNLPQTRFVSSLSIGRLVPNSQPTQHVSKPKVAVMFGTHSNKNIDTHSIEFNKSFAFFKDLTNK